MKPFIKIGTRESQLAVWQADLVKDLLADRGYTSALVSVKSEGDKDQVTPLYEMGVQGIFTRSLDTALLNKSIDIAVHSMKDVPTLLPAGIVQAAVLKRGNHKDVFVFNHARLHAEGGTARQWHDDINRSITSKESLPTDLLSETAYVIATGSVRRKAQWLHRYPLHRIENLRGNINTRIQKINESNWDGGILAAAGLERIKIRPESAVELDWMLPAPAQGAIMVVCRAGETEILKALEKLNDESTSLCTQVEKEFMHAMMGGCSMPVSALAQYDKKDIYFRGSILSEDGKQKIEVEKYVARDNATGFGVKMANELLNNGGREIADSIRHAK